MKGKKLVFLAFTVSSNQKYLIVKYTVNKIGRTPFHTKKYAIYNNRLDLFIFDWNLKKL